MDDLDGLAGHVVAFVTVVEGFAGRKDQIHRLLDGQDADLLGAQDLAQGHAEHELGGHERAAIGQPGDALVLKQGGAALLV